MTALDDAMQEHMAYIVLSEGRPFSYKDFLSFQVDNKEHKMAHGTFRNKMVVLRRNQEIELCYNTGIAFYTLKGKKFGKPMTSNHAVVHNSPFYKLLQELPLDKQSIHDIHLRFNVPDIWKIFSFNPNLHTNKRSKDILISSWAKNNAIVRIVIHKTDTVSVIIGCSLQPFPLDIDGIILFFNLLVRVEEKLQNLLDTSMVNYDIRTISIPEYRSWIVTMWHFGRDGTVEYTGEKFCITVENAQNILTRLYDKDFNGKKRIRMERQECPRKTVVDAIEEKLYIEGP